MKRASWFGIGLVAVISLVHVGGLDDTQQGTSAVSAKPAITNQNPATSGTRPSKGFGGTGAELYVQRDIVGFAPEEAPAAASEIEDTTYEGWWGAPTGDFIAGYWGLSPDALPDELELPEDRAIAILEMPIGESFASWETALDVLKQEASDVILREAGSWRDILVQGLGCSEARLGSAVEVLAEQIVPNVPLDGSHFMRELQDDMIDLLELQASVLEAQVQLAHRLLEVGNVDKFPLRTVNSGRGRQVPPSEGAARYRMMSLSGRGWVAQFYLYEGDSPRLDQLTRDLRQSSRAALVRSLERQLGVSLLPSEVDRLPIFDS